MRFLLQKIGIFSLEDSVCSLKHNHYDLTGEQLYFMKENTIRKNSPKNAVDMTVGSPTRHLLLFALPLFAGSLFQQFYNLVDTSIAGKYISANALAAIGACGSLNFLFFSLSAGLANGIGIIVSQYFGAKDEKKIKATIASSFYILTVSALVVSLLGILTARPLLTLLHTPEGEILNNAVLYLQTTCAGIIFIAFYNGVAAILRALGDSKTPLVMLIISSLLNIVMDLTLVIYFHMGVFGVALATVVSQAVSAAVCLTYALLKVSYFKLDREERKPHKDIIIHSFRLGVPLSIQTSMVAISMIILQGVVNGFGATVMAAYTISAKVDLIISQFYNAISMAITTYSGQNFGAGNLSRVKEGYKRGTIIITLYNCIMIPLVLFFRAGIVGIFVNDADVIAIGAQAQLITSFAYFALGMIYVPRGLLNGVGDAGFALIVGITEVACRIVYSFILTHISFIGQWGIWGASILTWATVATVCSLRFFFGKWRFKTMGS